MYQGVLNARRPIHDEVMSLASRLAQECHPQVALQHAEARARYARLTSACDDSGVGHPTIDGDACGVLAMRRSQLKAYTTVGVI